MKLTFYKYQGTGNDFVMIDNRLNFFPKNDNKFIAFLCDRKFGIGADGLILLESHEKYDFKMVYFNSDGNESSMCGNGGRCLVAFAKQMGVINDKAEFEAVDGYHFATIDAKDTVSLQMIDVENVKVNDNHTFLNTGSPHHIQFVDDVKKVAVDTEGAAIRYSDLYGKEGSNVNFVHQVNENQFAVRTYERGVENETLSCGTGVTAVAIAVHANNKTTSNRIQLQVEGGNLEVQFEKEKDTYKNVFLIGSATFVFEGQIEINTFQ